MLIFFELIGSTCLAFFIANSIGIMVIRNLLAVYLIWYDKDKYLPGEPAYLYERPIPPLDCPKCLSLWLAVCVCGYNHLPLIQIVLFSFIVYTIAKRL